MGNQSASLPMRLMCALGALATGYVAVKVGITGEFRRNRNVYELSLWARCLVVGVMGLFAVVAGWVAVRR